MSTDAVTTQTPRKPRFDVDAYLARIGYRGSLSPTEDVLTGLHLAQATSIPFENLDIHLQKPISLDLPSVFQKLVTERRGGYCYELNGLFLEVLRELGFSVTSLAARTLIGAPPSSPYAKTHMILMVALGERRLIADLGFGAFGLYTPLPFDHGTESRQFQDTYRVMPGEGPLHRVQAKMQGEWQDLYVFTLEPHYPADYTVMHYFNSTSKESRFTRRKVVMLPSPEARYSLVELDFKVRRGDETTVTPLADNAAYVEILSERFGIVLPSGSSFTFAPSS